MMYLGKRWPVFLLVEDTITSCGLYYHVRVHDALGGMHNTGFAYILCGYSVCELKQELEKGNLIASGSEIP